MRNKISFLDAIRNLSENTGNWNDNVTAVYEEVVDLCETRTETGEWGETSLFDWLHSGTYTVIDTAASIAEEWDDSNDSE